MELWIIICTGPLQVANLSETGSQLGFGWCNKLINMTIYDLYMNTRAFIIIVIISNLRS